MPIFYRLPPTEPAEGRSGETRVPGVSLLQAAVALRNFGIEVAVVNIPTVPA
ncbi:hypothetical protein [Actinomadura alba]|uniref:Uncharacterized protein n=1 Tax=Actinomadura alba TaxID=406431 RepID=A0ABR7LW50_9ACTN|nr:hypothetical protein [Actinomadura alba]MBC6468809.1 hypothetical protein [Actinomadura alba]